MKDPGTLEDIALKLHEDAEENARVHPIDYLTFQKYSKEILEIDPREFILFNAQHFHIGYFNKVVLYLIASMDPLRPGIVNWEEIFSRSNKSQAVKIATFLCKYCGVDAVYFYCQMDAVSVEARSAVLAEVKSYVSGLMMHTIDQEELDEIDNECNVKNKLSAIKIALLERGFNNFDATLAIIQWEGMRL